MQENKEGERVERRVSEPFQKVIANLVKQVGSNDTNALLSTYDYVLNHFFKYSFWPKPALIAPLANKDKTIMILYKELFNRHVYYTKRESKNSPNVVTIGQRVLAWKNFVDLFALMSDPATKLSLPSQWLWDIIDEYIFQFQAFWKFRSQFQPDKKNGAIATKNTEAWKPEEVLTIIENIVSKSGVLNKLKEDNPSDFSNLENIGFFCMIGLLRIHCLLGDYHKALSVITPIDLIKKGIFSRITSCHISLYYNIGFAYLMMHRYSSAINTFTTILGYIGKSKQFGNRSQVTQITKKTEQMYYLLAIAVALSSQKVHDKSINHTLYDKCGDRLFRIQKGDDKAYIELFKGSCPKFVNPAENAEAYETQLNKFLAEVKEQSQIKKVSSYLKLYSTISVTKLAGFLETDEDTLRRDLEFYKNKSMNTNLQSQTGEREFCSDIDFQVEGDTIRIQDRPVPQQYAEQFLQNIATLDQATALLQAQ